METWESFDEALGMRLKKIFAILEKLADKKHTWARGKQLFDRCNRIIRLAEKIEAQNEK